MFLSPDNYVQAPDNSQNFNRYTYCLNNPLMYTDPSGYTWFTNFGNWLGSNGRFIVTTAVTIGVVVGVTAICVATGGLGAVAIAAIAGASGGLAGAALSTAFAGGSGKDFAVNMLIGAGVGAVSGMVGYAAGGWGAGLAKQGILKLGTDAICPIANGALVGAAGGAIGGAAAGAVGGFLTTLIKTGDIDAAWKGAGEGALSGAKMGGIIGAGTGAYGGYKYAKANNLSPWSGKSLVNHDALAGLRDYSANKGDGGLLDCSDIASRLKNRVGSGDIYEITPKNGQWMNGMEYGQTEQFQYHQVYVNDGVVYDPMYSSEPMPYDDYVNTYKSMNSGNIQINKVH